VKVMPHEYRRALEKLEPHPPQLERVQLTVAAGE